MKNYKGEQFFDTTSKLLADLEEICQTIINNLKTKGQSYYAADILNAPSFNSLWQIEPNKHDNKYSTNEFKGVYAFAMVEENRIEFQYIGISQTIRRRFSAHTRRTAREEASWAYLMIKQDFPSLTCQQREKKIPDYQKKYIHSLKFTFCPVDGNMMLHIAEVYCVNRLKSYWNTFETH